MSTVLLNDDGVVQITEDGKVRVGTSGTPCCCGTDCVYVWAFNVICCDGQLVTAPNPGYLGNWCCSKSPMRSIVETEYGTDAPCVGSYYIPAYKIYLVYQAGSGKCVGGRCPDPTTPPTAPEGGSIGISCESSGCTPGSTLQTSDYTSCVAYSTFERQYDRTIFVGAPEEAICTNSETYTIDKRTTRKVAKIYFYDDGCNLVGNYEYDLLEATQFELQQLKEFVDEFAVQQCCDGPINQIDIDRSYSLITEYLIYNSTVEIDTTAETGDSDTSILLCLFPDSCTDVVDTNDRFYRVCEREYENLDTGFGGGSPSGPCNSKINAGSYELTTDGFTEIIDRSYFTVPTEGCNEA